MTGEPLPLFLNSLGVRSSYFPKLPSLLPGFLFSSSPFCAFFTFLPLQFRQQCRVLQKTNHLPKNFLLFPVHYRLVGAPLLICVISSVLTDFPPFNSPSWCSDIFEWTGNSLPKTMTDGPITVLPRYFSLLISECRLRST